MPTASSPQPDLPRPFKPLQVALRQQTVRHAYLFWGQARHTRDRYLQQVCQSLLCEALIDGWACQTCGDCRRVALQQHPNLLVLPTGANLAQHVRALCAQLAKSAFGHGRRVLFLPQADALNVVAQNALLKTLEEPPLHAVFVLGGQNLRSLLPTVRSRCQMVHVHVKPESGPLRADLDERLAKLLTLLGPEPESIEQWLQQGVQNVWDTLQQLLVANSDATEIFASAASLAADPATFELTMLLSEKWVRDMQAASYGVTTDVVFTPKVARQLQRASFVLDEIRRWRANFAITLNKTLILENILMVLADVADPHFAQEPHPSSFLPGTL